MNPNIQRRTPTRQVSPQVVPAPQPSLGGSGPSSVNMTGGAGIPQPSLGGSGPSSVNMTGGNTALPVGRAQGMFGSVINGALPVAAPHQGVDAGHLGRSWEDHFGGIKR